MTDTQLERKALYNLLRMNWEQDQSMEVEPWQVEDYRAWAEEELLDGLAEFDGQVSRSRFLLYAEQCDTPEELTGCFLEEDVSPEIEDRVYLLVFELWRRWLPESPSLSIFCDALDHLIWAYDKEEMEDDEAMQDGLAGLAELLDAYVDEGEEPHDVFANVATHCANDIESFIYDYIAEQIEGGASEYASELLDSFSPYVADQRWFDFLHARLLAPTDMQAANDLLWGVFHDSETDPDLQLNLELLDFLCHTGDRELFKEVATQTTSLLQTNEDLLDLLECCSNFHSCLDHEKEEAAVDSLIESCSERNPEEPLSPNDAIVKALRKLLG